MSDEIGLFEAMFTCRAMRRIKPDPVPEELLIRLIDAGNQAPSGSNAQSARFIVVRDRAQKEKLADLNMKVFVAYTAPDGNRPTSLPHQSADARERMVAAVRWQAEHFADVPAHIIACLEFAAPPTNSFAAGAGSGGSIWPAVQNILLAARGLGLAATPTTFAISDRAAAQAVLGLPDTISPFCLIPVGYPMGKFGPVTRKPVAEIMRWDRWS